MQVSPREQQQRGHQSELRKAELGSGGQGEEGEGGQSLGEETKSTESPQEATGSRLHWSPRKSKNKDVSSPERAGCC